MVFSKRWCRKAAWWEIDYFGEKASATGTETVDADLPDGLDKNRWRFTDGLAGTEKIVDHLHTFLLYR